METELDLAKYSPDGTMLAVGSHDNNIYIYSQDDYSKIGTLKVHNSFLYQLIRAQIQAQELLKSRIRNINGVICLARFVFLSNCNFVDVLINMSILHKLQKKLMVTLEHMLLHAMNVLGSIPKNIILNCS